MALGVVDAGPSLQPLARDGAAEVDRAGADLAELVLDLRVAQMRSGGGPEPGHVVVEELDAVVEAAGHGSPDGVPNVGRAPAFHVDDDRAAPDDERVPVGSRVGDVEPGLEQPVDVLGPVAVDRRLSMLVGHDLLLGAGVVRVTLVDMRIPFGLRPLEPLDRVEGLGREVAGREVLPVHPTAVHRVAPDGAQRDGLAPGDVVAVVRVPGQPDLGSGRTHGGLEDLPGRIGQAVRFLDPHEVVGLPDPDRLPVALDAAERDVPAGRRAGDVVVRDLEPGAVAELVDPDAEHLLGGLADRLPELPRDHEPVVAPLVGGNLAGHDADERLAVAVGLAGGASAAQGLETARAVERQRPGRQEARIGAQDAGTSRIGRAVAAVAVVCELDHPGLERRAREPFPAGPFEDAARFENCPSRRSRRKTPLLRWPAPDACRAGRGRGWPPCPFRQTVRPGSKWRLQCPSTTGPFARRLMAGLRQATTLDPKSRLRRAGTRPVRHCGVFHFFIKFAEHYRSTFAPGNQPLPRLAQGRPPKSSSMMLAGSTSSSAPSLRTSTKRETGTSGTAMSASSLCGASSPSSLLVWSMILKMRSTTGWRSDDGTGSIP